MTLAVFYVALLLHFSTCNDPYKDSHDRQYEKNMDETSDCLSKTDESHQPSDQE